MNSINKRYIYVNYCLLEHIDKVKFVQIFFIKVKNYTNIKL